MRSWRIFYMEDSKTQDGFDIFGQIAKEIADFKHDRIRIAGNENTEDARYLRKETRGYLFSQYDTINLIDLYYNSKFETGVVDSEGQRKLFLNICAFRSDVASKMVNIGTKDFTFIPDDESSKWGTYFVAKEFKDWSRENYFGETIKDFVENWPRYGTIVSKKVGDKIERVPLRNLINQQDATSLQTATHVIEMHPKMTRSEMESYPDWKTDGLDIPFGQTEIVYERYGAVPAQFYFEKLKGEEMPEDQKNESYDCLVICTLKEVKEKGSRKKSYTGTILFSEKITERPYRECHWKRQDGRWLGIGEVENQFENQISRNMIANMRRRSLLWASKKIFKSTDDTVNKNLIRDVKDGDVMIISAGATIDQVDMQSRSVGEFGNTEQVWEKNSDQKSFTYEAATGETMPGSTPFRLGVMLSNAVASHFGMKKDKLGMFFKKIIIEDVLQIFKEDTSEEHTMTVFGTADGINDLKKVASEVEYNKRLVNWALSGSTEIPNFDLMKQTVEAGYKSKSHLFITLPKDFYETIKHHFELTVTGEEIDTNTKIQSYTQLYQFMAQSQDPRATQVLDKIMELTGENLEAVLGAMNTTGAPGAQQKTGQPAQAGDKSMQGAEMLGGGAPETTTV